MVEVLEGFPDHVAAFRATGKVTGRDYDEVINPLVANIYGRGEKISFLYLIDTPLANFTAGAWLKDAILGFVYFTEWRRIAIVSDNTGAKRFTNCFGHLVPGKYRGYILDDYDEAKIWVRK